MLGWNLAVLCPVRCLARALVLSLVLGAGVAVTAAGQALTPVELLIADSSGAVIRVDPESGAQSVLSEGGLLVSPLAIAVVRIPGGQGTPELLTATRVLGAPRGIVVDFDGNLMVADFAGLTSPLLTRVDPQDGAVTTLVAGDIYRNASGLAIVVPEPDGLALRLVAVFAHPPRAGCGGCAASRQRGGSRCAPPGATSARAARCGILLRLPVRGPSPGSEVRSIREAERPSGPLAA